MCGNEKLALRSYTMTVYAKPGTDGSVMSFESRYDNWIGGQLSLIHI